MNEMRRWRTIVEGARAPQPTLNDNFWRWFGSSKVVDRKGNPQIVYHGGADGIEAFDPAAIGRSYGQDEVGFFFTDDNSDTPWGAKSYAHRAAHYEGPGTVYSVFLRIERPYTLEQFAEDNGRPVEDYIIDGDEPQHPMHVIDHFRAEVMAGAQKHGCDGLIFHYDGDATFVVFSPNQIKAVNNSGIWNVADDRIHH